MVRLLEAAEVCDRSGDVEYADDMHTWWDRAVRATAAA